MPWLDGEISPANFRVQMQRKYDRLKLQLGEKDAIIKELHETIDDLNRQIKNLKISNTLLKKNSQDN